MLEPTHGQPHWLFGVRHRSGRSPNCDRSYFSGCHLAISRQQSAAPGAHFRPAFRLAGAHFQGPVASSQVLPPLPEGQATTVESIEGGQRRRERGVHLRQGERSAHPQRLTFFRSTTAASETYRYRARAKSSLGCMQGDRVRPGPRQGRAQPNSRPALSVRRTETLGSRKATRYTIEFGREAPINNPLSARSILTFSTSACASRCSASRMTRGGDAARSAAMKRPRGTRPTQRRASPSVVISVMMMPAVSAAIVSAVTATIVAGAWCDIAAGQSKQDRRS